MISPLILWHMHKPEKGHPSSLDGVLALTLNLTTQCGLFQHITKDLTAFSAVQESPSLWCCFTAMHATAMHATVSDDNSFDSGQLWTLMCPIRALNHAQESRVLSSQSWLE